jgi:hypothetical protein
VKVLEICFMLILRMGFIRIIGVKLKDINTLRTGDADLRLYAYKQFKYPVPNVLSMVAWILLGLRMLDKLD